MKKSIILTIHGRVQGVGFRYFVKQKADLLGISGFVKNESDGTVFVEAEGDEDQLELFANFCRQGPSFARVDRMDHQQCPVQGYVGFAY